jgi:hypothetical protein
MSYFSDLDIEIKENQSGFVGVCLSDTRNPPRYFRLLDIPARMGIGYFEPLDDKGATVPFPLKDFWALIEL